MAGKATHAHGFSGCNDEKGWGEYCWWSPMTAKVEKLLSIDLTPCATRATFEFVAWAGLRELGVPSTLRGYFHSRALV